jgi:hypothetical protein
MSKKTFVQSWWQEFSKDGRHRAFHSHKMVNANSTTIPRCDCGLSHWRVGSMGVQGCHWSQTMRSQAYRTKEPWACVGQRLCLHGLLTWFQGKRLWGAGSGDLWQDTRIQVSLSAELLFQFLWSCGHISLHLQHNQGSREAAQTSCCHSFSLELSELPCL